jgi:hypothetical protein
VEQPNLAAIPMLQNTSSAGHMDDSVSIIQFLQRPVRLEQFQLSGDSNIEPLNKATITKQQKPIKSYNVPYDILNVGGKLAKANNHQYFKADVHIKIVLNANPFISGRFWLTYSPYEDLVIAARKQINASRAGVTAYPGIEIDAQLDNSVEMVIPFASFKEAYVLTTDKPENFVKIYLFALTKVLGPSTGTKAVIDMSVYAWFENIVINIPTSRNLVQPGIPSQISTISKLDKERLRIGRKISNLEKENPSAFNYIKQFIFPEQKRNFRKVREVGDIPDSYSVHWQDIPVVQANMQVQSEDSTQGPISGVASIVSGIASAVGKIPIPIVGEIASGVGWIADIVGNVASMFGWSRPTHMKEVCELANVPGKNYTHVEAIDNGVNLSLSNKNELDKAYNIFPSIADEMSLAYVCANPALKDVVNWSITSGEEGSLKTLAVVPVGIGPFDRITFEDSSGKPGLCPASTKFTISDNENGWKEFVAQYPQIIKNPSGGLPATKVDLHPYINSSISILDTTPCEYISQLFSLWRATICFKISVVKTAFHSGRLEIFFEPGPYATNDLQKPDLEYYDKIDTTNNYKYILDLTNDTEITIRIPFVSEQLFKSTLAANSRKSMEHLPPRLEDIWESMIGSLIIRPVSNLLAPETVAPKVDILIWKWAEDVVLGVPKQATQETFKIHDGSVQGNACPQPPPPLDNIYGYLDLAYLEQCPRVAARMQINIGNKAEGNTITFFDTTDIEGKNMEACKHALGERIVSLRPLLRCFRKICDLELQAGSVYVHDVQTDHINDSKFIPDYLTYLSYMYRFWRGGNRLKVVATKSEEDAHVISNIAAKGANFEHCGPTHLTFPKLNPIHEVTIPFYSQYRKLPFTPDEKKTVNDENVFYCNIKSSGAFKGYVLRAGNDDLTYGWLMGTPQLRVGSVGTQWAAFCASGQNWGPPPQDNRSVQQF